GRRAARRGRREPGRRRPARQRRGEGLGPMARRSKGRFSRAVERAWGAGLRVLLRLRRALVPGLLAEVLVPREEAALHRSRALRAVPRAAMSDRGRHLALFIRSLGSHGAGAERIW